MIKEKHARALLLALAFAGCGGGDGGGAMMMMPPDMMAPDETQKFLGTWTYQNGSTVTLTCSGAQPQVSPLMGNITLAQGTTAGRVVISTEACSIAFTVAGNVATLAGAQSCTVMVSDADGKPVSETLNYTAASLTTSDGANLQATYAGSVSVAGSAQPCAYAASAAATKASK
jgi:hypothetical protein